MNVRKVENNSISFGNFYADAKGTYNIASSFVGKPNLERRFMQNVIEPLMKTELYSVSVESNTVGIVDKEGKGLMSIVQPGSLLNRILAIVYDVKMSYRNAYRRQSEVIPTEYFKDDNYLLQSIEIAKNIVMDLEAHAKEKQKNINSKLDAETLEEKFQRLYKTFDLNKAE